jgi:hypothetical protein
MSSTKAKQMQVGPLDASVELFTEGRCLMLLMVMATFEEEGQEYQITIGKDGLIVVLPGPKGARLSVDLSPILEQAVKLIKEARES